MKESEKQLRRMLVDLLVGPTSLSNAERLVDNLFAANSTDVIMTKLQAISKGVKQ